ncbi:MAG: TonB family protein [Chthoniobacterales bacterium]|nr:TonB family protein [Chthoniobacterales bacterium]
MSQQTYSNRRSRRAVIGAVAAVLLACAGSVQAQWAAKPAPPLPRSVLDQAWSGSVVLGLVFESNGNVRDAQILRSSGIAGLDEIARDGAMKWRLDPASLQASDMTYGRRHMIKFYQNPTVARRVEPVKAFWTER